MFRVFAFVYGTASYAVFLLVFLYAVGFVAGVGVPRHVDNGPATAWPLALAIDAALLSLFALQHSGMARPAFCCTGSGARYRRWPGTSRPGRHAPCCTGWRRWDGCWCWPARS